MNDDKKSLVDKVELSAVLTVLGIILLFSGAIGVTLIAPHHVDPSWTNPSSAYQVQMYEVVDPHFYLSTLRSGSNQLQAVYHLKKDYSLLAFKESELVRFVAPEHLKKYITAFDQETLYLTSRLLFLREPAQEVLKQVAEMKKRLADEWVAKNPGLEVPTFEIYELFEPDYTEGFSITATDRVLEEWVDEDYNILDEVVNQPWHSSKGVVYVKNPIEYRVKFYTFAGQKQWRYDPSGELIINLDELKSHPLGFKSRKELIEHGEHLFAIEGCWYCHTDQTRTLIQDVVLNGSDSYPAPPSSASEYVYQKISFPGTRRIGPDVSRVGIKRPSRDWHQSHFWSPKTESKGSIMPAFRHFFDYDTSGTAKRAAGIPNYEFESIFQYLMTKGTRITAPTQAWWLGKDPVETKEIIEGRKKL